jgi:hypothetical protein
MEFEKEIDIIGSNPQARQGDIALRTNITENEIIIFNKLNIRKCGIGFLHNRGNLFIRELHATDFTADLYNSRGNLFIDKLYVDVDGSKLPYSDKYHMDALGQLFAPRGQTVSNVYIGEIHARIKGEYIQGMMLSEGICRYSNIRVGEAGANIEMDYKYAFVANQLDNSYINVGDAGIRISKRKASKYSTHDVRVQDNAECLQVIDQNLLEQKSVILV